MELFGDEILHRELSFLKKMNWVHTKLQVGGALRLRTTSFEDHSV
jgi:hypothetical protein